MLKRITALALILGLLAAPAAAAEPVYVAEVEENSTFLEDMTTASLSELCGITDVTAEYLDKARGCAFRLDLRGIGAEAALALLADAPWIARTASEQMPVSLKEAGFATIAEAEAAGHRRFYLDVRGFWGLDAGWLPIDDGTRLRDHAMPSGLLEYYVNPFYLYRTYLAPGMNYDRWQGDFLGISLETEETPNILKLSENQLVLFTETPMAPRAVAAALSEYKAPCGPYRAEETSSGTLLVRNDAYPGTRCQEYPDTILCRRVP